MYDDINKVKDATTNYIARSENLLRRLSVVRITDPALPTDISTWILEAMEEILPLMPNDHPDYNKLSKIKTQYADSQTILLPSAKADIHKVLQNLMIAHDCVLAVINADYKDLPPKNMASINYNQLKHAYDYVKAKLINKLKGREDGRTSKTVTLRIYGRIYLWIQSMIKMDGPEHCLALAASLRAILELYVDLNLIDQSKIKDGAEKFFSFTRVEKWKSAKKIVEMRKQFKLNTVDKESSLEEYLSKPDNSDSNIKKLRAKLWGKTKKKKPAQPKHWSHQDLRQRVNLLEDPEIADRYTSSYYWCNWCVHPMYFEMINNIENIHLFNWQLYELAYKMFRSSTELVNKTIPVLSKDDLEASFKNIEDGHFKCFFGEMVNAGRSKKG